MTDSIEVKPKGSCAWDAASLGEIMLRFDPGEGRIHTAREFRVWEGGGTWIVPKDALARGDYAEIERLAREASEMIR